MFPQQSPRVLAIGAHPDDIELGAGGFIHRLVHRNNARVHFLILTEGLRGLPPGVHGARRRDEAHEAAGYLGVAPANVEVRTRDDGRLHDLGHELIREVEERLFDGTGGMRFDAVLTHSRDDTHADHRAVHDATLSAVRSFHGSVLMYQSPSTTPNGFRPTFFPRLTRQDIDQKICALRAHVSQKDRVYMDALRAHGMAANWAIHLRQPPDTYLEAFEVYKAFF